MPVEIAYQTNAEPDVVHVIAVDVTAPRLPRPAIADFDLAVARRSAVSDHEMISQAVSHPADAAMVVIKHAGASLPRPAVVDDHEFPPGPLDWRAPDRVDVCGGKITIVGRAAGPWPESAPGRRRWRRLETLFLLQTGFLDRDVRR